MMEYRVNRPPRLKMYQLDRLSRGKARYLAPIISGIKFFTMHGVVMIFFFLIPSIPAVLGNFLIPLMIGAKDLAFPRLNLSSWYIFNLGGLFTLYSIIRGGVDTGWTFYTPYSSLYSNTHVVATVVGIFITGFSTILTGLNFIVTIHTMRAPGMTWFRLPLFV